MENSPEQVDESGSPGGAEGSAPGDRPATSKPLRVEAPPWALDEIGRRTMRLDLAASVLVAATQATIELGPALAKKGFNASDSEVALLTSGQSLGLILSFFVADLASRRRKMPLVLWPEMARSAMFILVVFLSPRHALGFVLLHAAGQMFQSMTIPARVGIYEQNYPPAIRGRLVGRNRQVQLVLAAFISLGMSFILDNFWSTDGLFAALGLPAPEAGKKVTLLVPLVGVLGLLSAWIFSRVPVREAGLLKGGSRSPGETMRLFWKVWREDRDFRAYQNFFFLFGFANIMTIPLTQIHAVDVLHASYLQLALINVFIVQGLMAITMVFWGKLLDRHSPQRLRGYINLVFSIDFLVLAIAPRIEWVYVGRICRGVALGGGSLIWMLGSLYYARTPEKVPIYVGIHTFLTGFRWALAPFASVWLKAWFGNNARPVFLLAFFVVAITAVLMIRRSRGEGPRGDLGASPHPAPRMTGA